MPREQSISIYLQDHLAGATTGVDNVNGAHPALAAIDFEALEARATAQRALVEQMIREIAPQALVGV